MIPVTNLRPQVVFKENENIYQVLSYEHTKMGRGTATIKVKVRNLRTGARTEKTFTSGAKVEEADLSKKKAQYLYKTVADFFFMDLSTFDQFQVSGKILGESARFLNEGTEVDLLFSGQEPLSLDLPLKMPFKVAYTEPGVKGNSAVNIYKEAVLENGLKIKVPLFVKTGETVLVDTRTGEYLERAGKPACRQGRENYRKEK